MHHTKTTLPNGLRVITVPMKDTKSLTLLVLFGTGSKYETKRISGVSHFLEHLFFKGTASRPNPGDVSRVLDDVGAEHNAFTSKEVTGYWVKAASKQFPLALDIVSDILLEPLFDKDEIEKERGVIFQEMNMYLDTPRQHIHDLFEELLYGDQPAGWDIIGTEQSLRGLSRRDIVAYRKSHYVGSNAIVVVAGNIDARTAEGHIEKAFSPLTAGTPKKKQATREAQKKPAVHITKKKTDQTHMIMGVRAYDMHDERRYAASLLASILGGKASSRLYMDIRERLGLVYTIGAGTQTYTDSGYLSVYAGVPHEKLEEVVRRVQDTFETVRTESVTADELKRAKDYYRGHFAISLESSDEVASFFAEQELFKKEIKTPEEFMRRIEQVTENDIAEVAADIFRPEGLNVALIGPHANKGKVEKLLV